MIKRFDRAYAAKDLRAVAIKEYMEQAGLKRAVCFSCGNASAALKRVGVDTLDISPSGDLIANRWFTPAEIQRDFPTYFDATSGHLPLHLMVKIARLFRKEWGVFVKDGVRYVVPTGSGETITCLRIAYPDTEFIAEYTGDNATKFERQAPLNDVVWALFDSLHAFDLR